MASVKLKWSAISDMDMSVETSICTMLSVCTRLISSWMERWMVLRKCISRLRRPREVFLATSSTRSRRRAFSRMNRIAAATSSSSTARRSVDCLGTTWVGRTSISCPCMEAPRMSASRSRAAAKPAASAFRATLVRGGSQRSHTTGSLSTPITAISSGTLTPAALQASRTCCPRSSLAAMMPIGVGRLRIQRSIRPRSTNHDVGCIPSPCGYTCSGNPADSANRRK